MVASCEGSRVLSWGGWHEFLRRAASGRQGELVAVAYALYGYGGIVTTMHSLEFGSMPTGRKPRLAFFTQSACSSFTNCAKAKK